ncbi:MAG: PEGA domain-containing protein [Terriglobia bacterium]
MESDRVGLIFKGRTVTVNRLNLRQRLPRFVLGIGFAMLFAGSAHAAQIPLREGTLIRLKLLYNVTTENVVKGDRVEFDVAENVVVNERVVIRKGAAAWGQVTEVKGAGNRKAKDAQVTFRFMAVKTVDNQQIALRALPTKPRKPDSHDNEIEENSLVQGMADRIIGAEKGKDYAAYIDAEAVVSAPEISAADQTGDATAAASKSPGKIEPAPPPPPEEAYVDFNSHPSGGDLNIDGKFYGNTPTRLSLPPGKHLIEIRLAGHRTWIRNMVVDPGSKPSVRATLDQE